MYLVKYILSKYLLNGSTLIRLQLSNVQDYWALKGKNKPIISFGPVLYAVGQSSASCGKPADAVSPSDLDILLCPPLGKSGSPAPGYIQFKYFAGTSLV